jgi:hypothetical protein
MPPPVGSGPRWDYSTCFHLQFRLPEGPVQLSKCTSGFPSSVLQVEPSAAQFPGHLWSSKLRRVALADWLARKLGAEANRASAESAGQGGGWHGVKGGEVSVDVPGRREAVDSLTQAAARAMWLCLHELLR